MKQVLLFTLLGMLAAPLSAQVENLAKTLKLAESGNAAAQFDLGFAYTTGSGVPKDDAEAVKWFNKAAEQALAN